MTYQKTSENWGAEEWRAPAGGPKDEPATATFELKGERLELQALSEITSSLKLAFCAGDKE